MTSDPTSLPRAQDHTLLRSVVLRHTATQKIIAAVVVTAVVLIWYDLLNRLLAFGAGIDYAALHVLGAEGAALLQRYNPFFWWVLVALCTLIIAYFLYVFVRGTARSASLRPIDQPGVEVLGQGLSAPAIDVVLWAWQDRSEPLRVADLQRARTELRNHRASKIRQAQHQLALLEDARRSR